MTMTPMTTSSDQRGVRSHAAGAFDLATVAAAKAATGTTVSACIPARDEDATVGLVVTAIRNALVDGALAAHGVALVDEIVVVDDHSTDDTAAVARAAGARVVGVLAIGHEDHESAAWRGRCGSRLTATRIMSASSGAILP